MGTSDRVHLKQTKSPAEDAWLDSLSPEEHTTLHLGVIRINLDECLDRVGKMVKHAPTNERTSLLELETALMECRTAVTSYDRKRTVKGK